MVRSTFHTLETSKRSLFTQQAAINTVGHNIANANTKGYSRQVVSMTAARPIEAYGLSRSVAPGQLGTGVEFTDIRRIRNAFLDDQYRNQNKLVGTYTIQADTLDKLEAIINEPSDAGLRTVLAQFWNAWSDLSKDPENVTGRKIVRESALALVDALNSIARQLNDLAADLTSNIEVKATEINTYITTIASLNTEIRRIEGLGDKANDLRDQRDLLVDELSRIANVSVVESETGYTVSIGGIVVVDGGTATQVTADMLVAAYQSGNLNSGEVHGMIVSRDVYVAEYRRQLDSLANTLANGEFRIVIPAGSHLPQDFANAQNPPLSVPLANDTVVTVKGINGLHQLGYTLEGGNPPATGGLFFVASDGSGTITAGNIALNPAIVNDVNKIATSMRLDSDGAVVRGNNTLALLMSELKEITFTFDETATGNGVTNAKIGDYYNALVGEIGVIANRTKRNMQNAQMQLDQVEANRQSVSGVSLDEEMSDLIRFQHAYNAAARLMTTFDEMLNKLINGTGVVGR
jgi:flagellar hook-associated protein 1 FlgK